MKYLFIILLLAAIKSYSQDKISVIVSDKQIEIKEFEMFENDITTIKNVYAFISTDDLQKHISYVSELSKNYKLKNCTFYFIVINSKLSQQEKEKKVSEALKFIQSRKMLLESDLYIISDANYVSIYLKAKTDNDQKIDNLEIDNHFDGYLIGIKESFILGDRAKIEKHIIDNK